MRDLERELELEPAFEVEFEIESQKEGDEVAELELDFEVDRGRYDVTVFHVEVLFAASRLRSSSAGSVGGWTRIVVIFGQGY